MVGVLAEPQIPLLIQGHEEATSHRAMSGLMKGDRPVKARIKGLVHIAISLPLTLY